jgi:hypothetical protein
VQLEKEDLDEFGDKLIHIICVQSFAQNGTYEELTVQMGFVSAFPSHDQCAIELLNHDVAKLPII